MDVRYKKNKLTFDDKLLRNIMRGLGRELKNRMKAAAPKLTGALKAVIDFRVKYTRKNHVTLVVGPKSRAEVTKKGQTKIPNKYAAKVGAFGRWISDSLSQSDVAKLKRLIGDNMKWNE